MAETQTHQDRKVKNYLLLGLLLIFAIVVFSVTIVKMSSAFKEASEQSRIEKEKAKESTENK